MTQYIDNMKIGDKLDFVGPKGHIIYKRNGEFLIRGKKKSDPNTSVTGIKNIGMIAGGSGITPMLQGRVRLTSLDSRDILYIIYITEPGKSCS